MLVHVWAGVRFAPGGHYTFTGNLKSNNYKCIGKYTNLFYSPSEFIYSRRDVRALLDNVFKNLAALVEEASDWNANTSVRYSAGPYVAGVVGQRL